ncbi:MAG TPA: polysaccharide deacetylase family protein [Terriglobales bacterium]|nr:polysaccharide deacetylase family protein [Terriglobales bacterium]
MAKAILKRILLASGALRALARIRGQGAAILMYHSVLDDPSQVENSLGRMIHSRQVFQGQMELLAREFRPVTIDQVLRFVKGELDLPERAVVVTFDDGYSDNYEVAMPILDRVGVPAAFYATIDCVEKRRVPWPSRLRFAFLTTPRIEWRDESGRAWPLRTPQDRDASYLAACDRVAQLAADDQEQAIVRMESDLDRRLPHESGEWMMTWEQLREITRRGHTVGSHTMTHPNLAFINAADARWELVESKRRLESRLGQEVVHFSYPCPALSPNWTEETMRASMGAGYATAVTTSCGLARRNDNPLALKRVRPTKTVDGLRWNLEGALAGRVA